MAAASSPHNLHAIQELWGMDGVNYAVNLIQSGHVDEALLLAALPSYSRAFIVAEENMKNVTLNQDAILVQENAIAQDMQDPFIVKYAEGQAKEQAIYAFGMDLTSQGEDLPGYKKEAAKAKDNWNTSKAALNRAVQAEQKASNTLSQEQAKFHGDISNPVAADAVVAAHQILMEASAVRKNAEKAFEISQQALTSALKNLDGAQQLARASVNAKARQSYEAFLRQRADTRENEQAGKQTKGPETMLLDQTAPYNVSNEGNEGIPLAQGNGSGIIGEGKQGENVGGVGNEGKKQIAEESGKAIVDIPFDETGKLMPNVICKSGEFSYDYETDSLGRIERFSTSDLHLTSRTGRLPHDQDMPGKLPSDHAGHLAGDRFGGSSELENLVSQSSDVNLSQYKRIENQWAKAIDAGKKVRVHVDIEYDNSNMRPTIFNVNYMIDDEIFTKTLIN